MNDEKEARILEAAGTVFLRYGYRRTTMGDLAQAAGISRPALYLRFCNKERIFEAVCRTFSARILEQIRLGLPAQATAKDKLRFAFELWVVQPFLLMSGTPDAKDLADCGLAFAQEAVTAGYAAFEEQLRSILETLPRPQAQTGLPPAEVAHILATTARGFKAAAQDVEELRALIDGLLKVVLAALA